MQAMDDLDQFPDARLDLVFLLGVVMLMVTRWFTGPAPGDRNREYVTAIRVFAWILTAASSWSALSWSCPDGDRVVRDPGRDHLHGL